MDDSRGHARTYTKKILFVTNAESGQANTILAMALEASTRPQLEAHVASFPILERRVTRLSPTVVFHPLDGVDMKEAMTAQGWVSGTFAHRPRSGVFKAYGRNMALILTAWEGDAYMRICDSIKKIITGLNPDVVVVDFFLNAGFDACYSLNREFVLSSPNTILDVARGQQPWMGWLWRYPMFGTGIPFPIPWKDLPLNIIAGIAFIWKVLTAPEVTKLTKCRNANGLPGRLPMESAPTRATHIISPCVREVDFPLVVPDNLGLYGPIVLDAAPIQVADPGLDQWLSKGETVLMCMGSHFKFSESQVKAILHGFLIAAPHDSNTQFLWKLPDKAQFEDLIEDALKEPRNKDRFKIVDWLDADPTSIMKHPNVIAWVHHGGANSYLEGALVGIPQIILGQWYDLYEMAVRAEYLGIGIYGNKEVAPGIEAVEFGAAVARLVRPGKESNEFRARAKAVAEACRDAGGKRAAVDKLIEIIDGK